MQLYYVVAYFVVGAVNSGAVPNEYLKSMIKVLLREPSPIFDPLPVEQPENLKMDIDCSKCSENYILEDYLCDGDYDCPPCFICHENNYCVHVSAESTPSSVSTTGTSTNTNHAFEVSNTELGDKELPHTELVTADIDFENSKNSSSNQQSTEGTNFEVNKNDSRTEEEEYETSSSLPSSSILTTASTFDISGTTSKFTKSLSTEHENEETQLDDITTTPIMDNENTFVDEETSTSGTTAARTFTISSVSVEEVGTSTNGTESVDTEATVYTSVGSTKQVTEYKLTTSSVVYETIASNGTTFRTANNDGNGETTSVASISIVSTTSSTTSTTSNTNSSIYEEFGSGSGSGDDIDDKTVTAFFSTGITTSRSDKKSTETIASNGTTFRTTNNDGNGETTSVASISIVSTTSSTTSTTSNTNSSIYEEFGSGSGSGDDIDDKTVTEFFSPEITTSRSDKKSTDDDIYMVEVTDTTSSSTSLPKIGITSTSVSTGAVEVNINGTITSTTSGIDTNTPFLIRNETILPNKTNSETTLYISGSTTVGTTSTLVDRSINVTHTSSSVSNEITMTTEPSVENDDTNSTSSTNSTYTSSVDTTVNMITGTTATSTSNLKQNASAVDDILNSTTPGTTRTSTVPTTVQQYDFGSGSGSGDGANLEDDEE